MVRCTFLTFGKSSWQLIPASEFHPAMPFTLAISVLMSDPYNDTELHSFPEIAEAIREIDAHNVLWDSIGQKLGIHHA